MDTEDEDGDLDNEEVEIMIDIRMVDVYFLVYNLYLYIVFVYLVRYCST